MISEIAFVCMAGCIVLDVALAIDLKINVDKEKNMTFVEYTEESLNKIQRGK